MPDCHSSICLNVPTYFWSCTLIASVNDSKSVAMVGGTGYPSVSKNFKLFNLVLQRHFGSTTAADGRDHAIWIDMLSSHY